MTMSKKIIPFQAQLVVHTTSLPFEIVVSRLDAQVNKTGTGDILSKLGAATGEEDLISIVNAATDGRSFLYFTEYPYYLLLQLQPTDRDPKQRIVVYIIGNPLIAQKIIKQNPNAAVNIPLRLLVWSNGTVGGGTQVSYHLPSSTMGVALSEDGSVRDVDESLRSELLALDQKLETLVSYITDAAPLPTAKL